MSKTAKLDIDGKVYELPTLVGTEGEHAVDISKLRSQSGYITLDESFGNTGSCKSDITFIDGEAGILRYRGYDIADLAQTSNFIETAYLLNMGELPTEQQLKDFRAVLTKHDTLHEDMKLHLQGFPSSAHPMAILSAMINASSCYYPDLLNGYSSDSFMDQAARIISKTRTIAAFSYRKRMGLPFIYPKADYTFTENFLHMMFSRPDKDYELKEDVVKALDLIFLLHADHEQNCSTSTVRTVASSRANLFASAAAGVCALWGPLHGGANQAVIEMLQDIHKEGDDGSRFVAAVKDKSAGKRLMGFGHRVYKNFDPRAKIIKEYADKVLEALNFKSGPLLDIAKHLEEVALKDDYFISRKLYPNVDFYSGIILGAIGIPVEMFTVIFAIGRMPGWTAHYREVMENNSSIYRPRQVYVGPTLRGYTPIESR